MSIGSVHFIADGALDMDEYSVWGSNTTHARSVEEIWLRYFRTVGESARCGLFDVIAHPDLVKVWGDPRRMPSGDLRRYYEPAVEGIAEAGVAVEVSTAGSAQAGRRDLPGSAFLEMCVQAGVPVALSSDAHAPQDVGAGYEQALAAARAHRTCASCACSSGRTRRLEPVGAVAGAR